MKRYYIYHIEGVKIGVSTNPQKRVQDQGYTDFEILEEHTDIYVVSDREKELQKQYGYRVDTNPYWMTIQKRSLAGTVGNKKIKEEGKGIYSWTKEDYSTHNKQNGLKAVESGQLASVRNVEKSLEIGRNGPNGPNKQRWLCPGPEQHISSGANYKRWCIFRNRDYTQAIRIK
jgi:hypothetical protein